MLQRSPSPNAAPAAPGNITGQASGAARANVLPMIEVSVQRLEEIVDQETSALRERKPIDLKDFNNRKSQALLELTRSLRHLDGIGASPSLAARVGVLKEKLAVNQAILRLHLEAVREISTTLADAIRHSESDGTYTQAISSIRRS